MKDRISAQVCHDFDNLVDVMPPQDFMDTFIYLTNPARGKHTTVNKLKLAYYMRTFGKMLKRYDPIAFNQEVNNRTGK